MAVTESDREQLAEIFKALGNTNRLAILERLEEQGTVSDLHNQLGMSRSGLQKHIEVLMSADLVYRPQDSGQTYDLTYLGELAQSLIEEKGGVLLEVQDEFLQLYQEKKEDREDAFDVLEESGVDDSDLREKITSKAWADLEEGNKDS